VGITVSERAWAHVREGGAADDRKTKIASGVEDRRKLSTYRTLEKRGSPPHD